MRPAATIPHSVLLPNQAPYPYHHRVAATLSQALRPTQPLSLPLPPPQPLPSPPSPALPSPTSSLGPPGSSHLRTFFCSWLRVLHVRLRAGLVGLEDTLPFIRGPTEWAYFSHLRNPLCFLPEKWAEASLWNLAGGMSLSKRPPLSPQTSQSRPSLPCSFVGMEREWNLTRKVKRAGENTTDGPTLLPTKA